MRPYLALIKDSFRAAIASNVLYVVLGVITLLLLVLAPLHVRESLDWRLIFRNNVVRIDSLAERLVERGENAEKYPTIARVWERLDSKLQADLSTMVAERKEATEQPIDAGASNNNVLKHLNIESELENALNDIIKQRDLYDEQAWSKKRLSSEAKDLLEEGVDEISDEQSRRLNRLLLASAFGRSIKRGGGNALNIWYGPWQWEDLSFPVSHKEFKTGTLQTVTFLFDWVLSVGLFIAILITANFIPETFLPGSLNLLMSKPVSRWGLLLAKFVGGCAFVSLCAVYLFAGVWLWLGIQMSIWDYSILWAIPLYILVFAIYYSVSTFVGVYSRNAILSIVVTILFWAACFLVGTTYNMFEGRINNSRTRGLTAVKDKVLHKGELHALSAWDEANEEWNVVLEPKMTDEVKIAMGIVMFLPGAGDDGDFRTVGPIYDPKRNEILSGVMNLGNPQATMNNLDLFVGSPDDLKFEEVGKMPRDAVAGASDPDGALIFTRDGRFMRYTGDPDASRDDKKEDEGESKSGLTKLAGNFLNSNQNKKKKKELFKQVGPDKLVNFRGSNSITYNSTNRSVYILADDELTKFDPAEGEYKIGATADIESSRDAIVASAGKYVIAVLTSGKIMVLDSETLDQLAEGKPQVLSPYRQVYASDSGKYFAFRCRNKTLWVLDTDKVSSDLSDAFQMANVSGQRDVTAAGFDDQDRLWYSTRFNRTRLVDLASSSSVKNYSPPTGWFDKAYEYVIYPLYWVFPKPGEFYKVVNHLTSKPDEDNSEDDVDLRMVSDAEDPWQPLWSGLLFMCGMLFLTGLIFQFRDF